MDSVLKLKIPEGGGKPSRYAWAAQRPCSGIHLFPSNP
jgi:hypothetical protein